jgi:hypothetical protein
MDRRLTYIREGLPATFGHLFRVGGKNAIGRESVEEMRKVGLMKGESDKGRKGEHASDLA